jgi:hypothetical protein
VARIRSFEEMKKQSASMISVSRPPQVGEILKTLETLGRAHRSEGGKFRP